MLKVNTLPEAGYANGSQGRMIGVVHEDSNYVLPTGSPGEMIMIPPPSFIIMEVHHKGKVKKTSILPCKKQETELEYYRERKTCVYRCFSNMTVLIFALTVHEVQGQTLRRAILLLGRLPGMNVGKITWSLLYVALSRVRKLRHVKFFPTGSDRYFHSMYFAHLLKLKMPTNLKKWHRSYVNHTWDRNILRSEHEQSVRNVERRLKRLGKIKTKGLKWIELQSFLKQMGYKTTTKDRKPVLFCKLKEHMVKRSIWKNSRENVSCNRKSSRDKKRKVQEVDIESFEKSRSTMRQSKRLRRTKHPKNDHALQGRRSQKNSTMKRLEHNRRIKRKCLDGENDPVPQNVKRKKILRSNLENSPHMVPLETQTKIILFPQQSDHKKEISLKGLDNLGQTCYFNSIAQCLLNCSLFRNIIENIPKSTLCVTVLRELRLLFIQMTSKSSKTHISTSQCFAAIMDIPECKRAQMNRNKQEDAAIFFLILMEYLRLKFKSLTAIFEGNFRSNVKCLRCSRSYFKTDSFKVLSLCFPEGNYKQDTHIALHPYDLCKLLDDFVKPEIISGYFCTQCAAHHPAEKTLSIHSPPKVLVLQLKRFQGLQKIRNYVRFHSQLSLKYIRAGNEKRQHYRLSAVVVHIGQNLGNGHYLSFVNAGEKWFQCNDHVIQEVCWETIRLQEVYLLFYVRL